MKKRVIVGLSGGVDSSVAAYLLKKEGYDVIGLFMKNWHDESVTISNECPWLEDSNDAILVAEKIGIPFQAVDLSKEYKELIVDYMFDEYAKGRTPNPDILCNREIKFNIFLNIARSLGADFIATGHYSQKNEFINPYGDKIYRLIAGKDSNKDQSYFLCQLNQEQLSKVIFPIGHLMKSEVRKIAKNMKLVTSDKKDSQGLCFVGKVSLPDFLQQKLKPKKGKIIEIPFDFESYNTSNENLESLINQSKKIKYSMEDGKLVGEHHGAHFFTIGQRKGLRVGGTSDPLFVLDTDVKTNIIFVGQGKNHPGLYRKALKINTNEIHWVRNDQRIFSGETLEVMARIRYRQTLQKARLCQTEGVMYVVFEKPQSSITSGQFIAWYKNDELLGSGVIN